MGDESPRVLFASTYAHLPDLIGGAEIALHESCLALRERGFEVAVLCGQSEFSVDTESFFPAPTSDSGLGYEVVRAPVPLAALPWIARRFRPDVLVVNGGALTSLAAGGLDLGLRTAVYFHNTETLSWGGILLPHPNLLYLANSRFTADRLRAMLGVEAEVVFPIVRPERYGTKTTRERVLFVNPVIKKGVELCLGVAERRPDIPFTIIESWSLNDDWRDHYQGRAAALGNVEWLAPVRDMRDVFSRARILFVPSVWDETFCRTVLEAQISGIPALASAVGGLPDTVGPGGVLVNAHAPLAGWLAALDRMRTDAAFYDDLCVKARDHAHRPEVDPGAIADCLARLLTDHARPRVAGDQAARSAP